MLKNVSLIWNYPLITANLPAMSETPPTPPATTTTKYTITLNGSEWSVAKYGVVEYMRKHPFLRGTAGFVGAVCGIVSPLYWAGLRPEFLKHTAVSTVSPILLEIFVAGPLLWMATVSGPAFSLVFGPAKAAQELQTAEKKLQETKKPEDAATLDFTRLNEYYRINQNQARSSFRWAIFAMFLGFATIVAGVWLFYFKVAEPDKFMASLSTGSGIVVSLTSALFLNLYGTTQDRSLHFYQQLSRLQRMSLAIRLVDEHKDAEEQTKARNLIIQQLLSADPIQVEKP
jgi:hypothetical protein